MASKPSFIFSANSLQDYLDCPRRFELKYILKQAWPALSSEPALQFEHHIALGNQFHQYVNQFISGVPLDPLLESIQDSDLQAWFRNFLDFYQRVPAVQKFSEFRLLTSLQQQPLIAVCDLIVISPEGDLSIYDWKTMQRIPKKEELAHRIQTLLYPFIVLQTASHFLTERFSTPEKIRLHYVYVAHTQDNVVEFPYSAEQHRQNQQYLENLIAEILNLQPGSFPCTPNERACAFCAYRSLCERGKLAGNFAESPQDDLAAFYQEMDFDAQDEMVF